MRVLVTGAAGFVGARVVRALRSTGHEAHALVRPGADLRRLGRGTAGARVHRADLGDAASVRRCLAEVRPEACVHLAWYVEPGCYAESVRGAACLAESLDLAEALAQSGCGRLVCAGTCAEYAPSTLPLAEDDPLGPMSLYACAKASLYRTLMGCAPELGISVAWARLFHLYGPAEDPRRLVSSILLRLMAGEPALLTHGAQIRDFLHVDDAASALAAIAGSRLEGAVNVGSGVPVTVREVAAAAGAAVGRPDLLDFGAIEAPADEPPVMCAQIARLTSGTRWRPARSLRGGMADTARWHRQHAPSVRRAA